ncbi:MAG: NAD(P)/FAD-dependent oxidoreductase [Eubacterium sp.]|nr:NAD(P)/FAD-dependent oxidoreductase [Eubacterium sp.]
MLPADSDVIVVGGGAAGMMAAVFAADRGEKVLLLEKNEKTGKKLYITGKGRCNFTNACEVEDIFPQVVTNAKFLYSCIYGFTNHDVIDWFREQGLPVKEERGGRMFPVSDKSSDVIRVLDKACRERKVTISLHTEVKDILTDESHTRVTGVRLTDGTTLASKRVILATGGVSYPSTGSTGDGLRMAEALGHRIVEPRPGLTGLSTKETDIRQMQGLTLLNTAQTIRSMDKGGKKLLEGFGELLFTHFGVSGPTMLTVSSKLGDRLQKEPLRLTLDIKPALSEDELDRRVLREIESDGKKSIGNLAGRLLPKSMIPVFLDRCEIATDKRGFDLTREERLRFVREMKSFSVTLTGVRDFKEAIITRGGVAVKDVNPSSMESKIISGLYFAGEMLDVDALTGGYNLQIAWSTGAAAGCAGN